MPDSGGTPATVIITIDIEDLLNGTGYGLTSDGTLIRTDQVRDLTDQAEAYYAFLDRNGVVAEPGPDPTHRHPRPIRRADRPRRAAAAFPAATEPPNGPNDITSFPGSTADPPT